MALKPWLAIAGALALAGGPSGRRAAAEGLVSIGLASAAANLVVKTQLVFYESGVGTRRLERLRGGAFGLGLSRNVRAAYRFLIEHYEPGDQVYLFGFSRGAFTARSTAGLIRNSGILRAEHASRISGAYRLYRARRCSAHPAQIEARLFRRTYAHPEAEIHFVGVWDTVGSLGIPIDGIRMPLVSRLWRFHDTELSSHVRYAYHALAIDEQRRPFRPTLWTQQENAVGKQALEQVWFAGAHSDVGGGYAEPELAEIPLLWMVERARRAGLAFKASHFRPSAAPLPERRALGELVSPDHLGRLHNSRKGLYRLLPRLRRPLATDGGAVAMPALERHKDDSCDYRPANLEAYLRAGGAIARADPSPAA